MFLPPPPILKIRLTTIAGQANFLGGGIKFWDPGGGESIFQKWGVKNICRQGKLVCFRVYYKMRVNGVKISAPSSKFSSKRSWNFFQNMVWSENFVLLGGGHTPHPSPHTHVCSPPPAILENIPPEEHIPCSRVPKIINTFLPQVQCGPN